MIGIDVWNGTPTQVQNYAHGAGRNITYPIGMQGGRVGDTWGLDRSSFVIVDRQGVIQFVTPQTTHYTERLTVYDAAMRAKLEELIAVSGLADPSGPPDRYIVLTGTPNPFREQTTIRLRMAAGAQADRMQLYIVTLLGRRVRTLFDGSGKDVTIHWDGTDRHGGRLPSGIYFLILNSERYGRFMRRLVLLH